MRPPGASIFRKGRKEGRQEERENRTEPWVTVTCETERRQRQQWRRRKDPLRFGKSGERDKSQATSVLQKRGHRRVRREQRGVCRIWPRGRKWPEIWQEQSSHHFWYLKMMYRDLRSRPVQGLVGAWGGLEEIGQLVTPHIIIYLVPVEHTLEGLEVFMDWL